MNAVFTVLGIMIFALMCGIAFGALLAFPVMWLWNSCLVGAIAGVAPISWLQAWGLMILSSLLIKSYGATTKYCESK